MKPTSIALFSTLAALSALSVTTAQSLGAETLEGVVRYVGPELEVRMLDMSADPKCVELHGGAKVADESISIGDGGAVANAFVWLPEAPAGTGPFEAPDEPVRLEQHGCFYRPRVAGIQVEQTLEVVNDDPTLHNVRSLARSNRPINLGQPVGSPPRTKFFTKPEEALKFKCDVHAWMAAYFFVLDHPFYAVTDENGKFSIPGLPPGKYELSVWHEILGQKKIEVEVGQPVEIELDKPAD